MKVLVTQSNYVPWRGYFAAIRLADLFVLYDTVQYTTRDWRNRNRILSAGSPTWLSIPVTSDRSMNINQVDVSEVAWVDSHSSRIRNAYLGLTTRKQLESVLSLLDSVRGLHSLSNINQELIQNACELLGITTPIIRAEDFFQTGDPSERLASIAEQTGASTYITGPAARNYMSEIPFLERGIAVQYLDYERLPSTPEAALNMQPLSIIHNLLTLSSDAIISCSTFTKDQRT